MPDALTTPAAFISHWQKAEANERANSQSFLIGLAHILGVPLPSNNHADGYSFEFPVKVPGGTSTNFIDLYRRAHFILESKQFTAQKMEQSALELAAIEAGAATDKKKTGVVRGTGGWDDAMIRAKGQAERYVRYLPAEEPNPPFIIVCDVGHSFEVYADFTQNGKAYLPFPDPRTFRIQLKDLADEKIRERLHLIWTNPLALDPSKISADVTREIAGYLAELAKSLEQEKHDPETVAQFLTRCLFCMFAEDVGLLPDRAFSELLNSVPKDGTGFEDLLGTLFREMNKGTGKGISVVLRKKLLQFNGGLFQDDTVLPVNGLQLGLLKQAASKQWKNVEPAIFGTLLERALVPEERHALGAHFTPRAYVERLVLPTVIDPLREEFENVYAAAVTLATKGDLKKARQEMNAFHDRLCQVRVLDPACGSGNFLYVALQQLKILEGELLDRAAQFGEDMKLELETHTIDPHQFLGIELNPRAASIAELVLWIGYLQWHFKIHGQRTPPEPILRAFKNIECRDAVLQYDGEPQPARDEAGHLITVWDRRSTKTDLVTNRNVPDETKRVPLLTYANPRPAVWPEADYIVGNPPFIGKVKLREDLGDGYAETLRATYPEVPESADFVLYWWHKAAALVRGGKATRFGLITTNSLRQTFARRVVEMHLKGSPIQVSSGGAAGSSKGTADSSEGAPSSSEGAPSSSRETAGSSEGAPSSSGGSAGSSRETAGSSEGAPGSSGESAGSSKGTVGSSEGAPSSSGGSAGSSKGTAGSSEEAPGSSGGSAGSSRGTVGSSEGAPGSSGGIAGSSRGAADSSEGAPSSAGGTVGRGGKGSKPAMNPEKGLNSPPLSLLFAIPDHPWVDTAEGAAVRIAMTVGAAGEQEGGLLDVIDEQPHDDGSAVVLFAPVKHGKIAADLSVGADVTTTVPLKSNELLASTGLILGGRGFVLTEEEAAVFKKRIPSAAKLIAPLRNGEDINGSGRGAFVIDTNGWTEDDLRREVPELYQHLLTTVYPERQQNRDPKLRKYWWLFRRSNEQVRNAIAGLRRFIATVETSKHRMLLFLEEGTKPEHKLVVIGTDDAFHLGVLSSRIHVTFALATGGWLGVGNDPVYSKTRCFDPFPFPLCNEAEKERIRKLAEELDAHRKRVQARHPDLTLTGMYNVLEKLRAAEGWVGTRCAGSDLSGTSPSSATPRKGTQNPPPPPSEITDATQRVPTITLTAKERDIHDRGLVSILKQLHDDLDAAVFAAYGWRDLVAGVCDPGTPGSQSRATTDAEILTRLVALNAERAAEEKRGIIHWLRPEYQNPKGASATQDTLDLPEKKAAQAKDGKSKAGSAKKTPRSSSGIRPSSLKTPWPKPLADRIRATEQALHAAKTPVTAADLTKNFSRAKPHDIQEILESLVTLGRARMEGERFSV